MNCIRSVAAFSLTNCDVTDDNATISLAMPNTMVEILNGITPKHRKTVTGT